MGDANNSHWGEEEDGESPFCLFMKGGGCKDAFIAWEDCVQEAEDNKEAIVEKCLEVTGALRKCMQGHADYYEPVLPAAKEEKGESPVSLFMKGGGCKDAFIALENCFQEAADNKEDTYEKCLEVTGALRKCMQGHADYYEPILRAAEGESPFSLFNEPILRAAKEEEGDSPFSLFMKGGGCKDAFIAWEDCVQEAEDNKEDTFEKCFEVTAALAKCMQGHADYYEPILRDVKEKAMKEMDKEKNTKEAESNGFGELFSW